MTPAVALRPARAAPVPAPRGALAAPAATPERTAPVRAADHLRLPAPGAHAPDARQAALRRVLAGVAPAADGAAAQGRVAEMKRVLFALDVAQRRVGARALPEATR